MTGTSNAVATREPTGALAIQAGQLTWDDMQLAALAQLGIKDAPDGDKQVFLHVSQRTGLDPFARQIYMIGRNEKKSEKRNGQWVDTYTTKWTIQTGIDGWRVIRDRAERRAGVRGIKGRFIYYAPDGSEHKAWIRREPPVAIEMTYTIVEPGGREVPYTSVLRFSEYVQTKTVKVNGEEQTIAVAQWATKPTHMLEKCTEADAYRCAFPQDYSGVVLEDASGNDWDAMTDGEIDANYQKVMSPAYQKRVTAEMARERAAARQAQVMEAEIVDTASREQVDAIWGHLDRLGHKQDKEWRLTVLSSILDREISSSASLTTTDAVRVIADLEAREPAGMAPHPAAPDVPGDPRDAVLASLAALGIETTPAQLAMIARFTGRKFPAAASMTRKQAQWLADRIAPLGSRDELEAAATAAEARREENPDA
jgi:phage recombination protein Bet